MSNDEYVTAFRALQELICDIYDEIVRTSPFVWGWQGWKDKTATGGSYGVWNNRIMGILGAFAEVGYIENDALIVDKKTFSAHDIAFKKHRFTNKGMADMVVTGLMDMGLMFEG
ncbi:MAG: hypothetical protein FWC92_01505 [Defluviitaleaceae bacterium]|nr:hypothetical protein [Defluviitaleaceae bacterium]